MRHSLLCNRHTYQDTRSLGKIPVLLGFDVQVVAGWRSQAERKILGCEILIYWAPFQEACRSVYSWRVVENNGGLCKNISSFPTVGDGGISRKQELSLPNNCVPVTKLRLNSLKLENQEMNLTICALNAELAKGKKILAYNQLLVSLGAQLEASFSSIKATRNLWCWKNASIFYPTGYCNMTTN